MYRSRKILLASLSLVALFAFLISSVSAEDNEATAEKLVKMVPADAQRPDYYTGTHGFMNDEELAADNGGPLEKGLYIMSWLAISPPIKLGAGGGAAAIQCHTERYIRNIFRYCRCGCFCRPQQLSKSWG